jgi:hypothetical protein
MARRAPELAEEYRFTREHMIHLDTVLKVLERSPGGMTAREVSLLAASVTRLRTSIREAIPEGREGPLTPVAAQ